MKDWPLDRPPEGRPQTWNKSHKIIIKTKPCTVPNSSLAITLATDRGGDGLEKNVYKPLDKGIRAHTCFPNLPS